MRFDLSVVQALNSVLRVSLTTLVPDDAGVLPQKRVRGEILPVWWTCSIKETLTLIQKCNAGLS
jgi:hypothetical protein